MFVLAFFFPIYFCDYSALSIPHTISAWSLPRTKISTSEVNCQPLGYKGSEVWSKLQ